MRRPDAPGSRRPPAGAVAIALVAVSIFGVSPAAGAAAPELELGSAGRPVRAVQQRLAQTGFLGANGVDGRFGRRTWHAVVAFQGWNRLARDGVVGPRTHAALRRARRPRPWSSREGFEIHVGRQVLLMIRDGRVHRAVHVSTGAGGSTPTGRFRVLRRERMSWSTTFRVWMPYAQYFWGGYALHEYPIVPAYPASHGCVRVPAEEVRGVWDFGRVRMRVWIGEGAAPRSPAAHDAAGSSGCGDRG